MKSADQLNRESGGMLSGLLSERSLIQTSAGPTLRFCLCNDICKRSDFLVFSRSDKHENEKP